VEDIFIKILWIYILSLVPGLEGRYALVVGKIMGLNLSTSFLIASFGVITLSLILPTVLPYIDKLMLKLVNKGGLTGRIATMYLKYLENVRRRSSKYVNKWGIPGLILFVSIPLPATGVWTGSVAAYILGMRRRAVISSLLIGGLISNIITLIPSIIIT